MKYAGSKRNNAKKIKENKKKKMDIARPEYSPYIDKDAHKVDKFK